MGSGERGGAVRPRARRPASQAGAGPISSANRYGSSTSSWPSPSATAAAARAGVAARACSDSAAPSAAPASGDLGLAPGALQAGPVGVGEALRIARVDDHRVERQLVLGAACPAATSVSLTGISSAVATATTAVNVAVGDRGGDRRGPGGRSARRGRSRRTSAASAGSRRRARRPANRRSPGHTGRRRRCGARAGPAPTPCRCSAARACPAWPSRTPGTAGSSRAPGRRGPVLTRRYSSIAGSGIDRDREQPVGELDLLERLARLRRTSAAPGPGWPARRRSSAARAAPPRARARPPPSTCRPRPCR